MAAGRERRTTIVNVTHPTDILLGVRVMEADVYEISRSIDDTIRWLATYRLIHNTYTCPICGNNCSLVKYTAGIDSYRWMCYSPCNMTKSIRHGSFFSQSHLRLSQILHLTYKWCTLVPANAIAREVFLDSEHTVTDWANFCREVCSQWLENHPASLGGLDPITLVPKVVEIDESNFIKRKYHRGRLLPEQWVFGAVERGNTSNMYLECVASRDAATLLPIIEDKIEPGTIIVSDMWAAYNNIRHSPNGYEHLTVNHSLNFVNPNDRDAHTQTIEGMWARAKRKLKNMNGTSPELFRSYLDEFQWRCRNSTFGDEKVFVKFLIALSEVYIM